MKNRAHLTPSKIVEFLDRYIVGQNRAKRAVAIAIRNRMRRLAVDDAIREDIIPKNILMIGSTGVGKTEIARRLAKLMEVPFIKVEATKYTEVGYVGRDVDSIIRDLVEMAIASKKAKEMEKHIPNARLIVQEKILDLLLPRPSSRSSTRTRSNPFESIIAAFSIQPEMEETEPAGAEKEDGDEKIVQYSYERERLRTALERGELEDEFVEIEVRDQMTPFVEVFSSSGIEEMGFNFQNMLGNIFPEKKKRKKVKIKEARPILEAEEVSKLLDMDSIIREAIREVEEGGIVFIDEIDKVAGPRSQTGPDVSREGVQRDLLPLLEGTTVMTKYGPVRTHHVLFIAAGAFHVSKPSELIPELQGRFPIRVELEDLTREDLRRILVEPDNSILKQYQALFATEKVSLEFEEEAIDEIAELAFRLNAELENIGARRLFTLCEKVLEKYLFEIPEAGIERILVTRDYVRESVREILENRDLSRYVL